jgi:SPP1 family predicted phage head-tail adaptor
MSAFRSMLISDVAISRPQRTSDGKGGWVTTHATVATYRGRLRPASSGEREVAMQEQRHLSHILYVEYGADIRRNDQATVGNLTVKVESIREPSTAGEHLEIDCREVQLEHSA